jgi:hypothetical protein
MVREAERLAKDGEIGNSDAIRLLQVAHGPEELREVLARFDQQLTCEARSKLTLAAFAPLPENVDNQRYEPIFDRYPITGKTYTTASGTVVLNEIQYYNGRMVQLYGECTDAAGVGEALAGTGYRPLLLRHAHGRETAIAQFWAHRLSDTSLRPYDASFIVVAAVRDDTPSDRACIRADRNGVSSVLSMIDGCFDPAKVQYVNRACLCYVRLLDSTRVAIEVGRERMGTDKRPGSVELTQEGSQFTFSVKDAQRQAVARVGFVPTGDPDAFLAEVAKAAATAGIAYCGLPRGTEYVYPAIARIGKGPIVNWEWRTDVAPRLQPVPPGAVTVGTTSEEGELLTRWGFQPRVLGYIPNVRGAVTGVPERASPRHLRVRIRAAQPSWSSN